jgi:3-methyladenine DNA glycosylase AlkD
MTMTARAIRARLRSHAVPANVAILQRFFKTGPGEYGEGDTFIGVKAPSLRSVCGDCRGASFDVVLDLLHSKIHEERLLALLMLVDAFQRGDQATRKHVYDLYLANTTFINNWDLVDASAAQIVGGWLHARSHAPLVRLAKSRSLWERRIAIVATYYFIKRGEFDDTFRISDLLLKDEHDLIHKAVGWMLREVGKRDGAALRRFLAGRYETMPRTMLRYAIEKFGEPERRRYLRGQV